MSVIIQLLQVATIICQMNGTNPTSYNSKKQQECTLKLFKCLSSRRVVDDFEGVEIQKCLKANYEQN